MTSAASSDEWANAKLAELYRTSAEARARLEDKLTNTEEGRRLLAERLAAKAGGAKGVPPAAV